MPAINISHTITRLTQPNQNDCWAAAIAMATGYTIQRVKNLAAYNSVDINTDGSLVDGDHQNIVRLCRGFQMRPYRTARVPAIARLAQLMRHRPVVLLGTIRGPAGQRLHALTIFRLTGEGRMDNTFIELVDPFNSQIRYPFRYDDFCSRGHGPIVHTDYILA